MLSHAGYAGVLATLSLHTVVWIIDLLLGHVAALRNATRHAAMVGWHRGHVFRRFWNITRFNTILVASWFWSVETSLEGQISAVDVEYGSVFVQLPE
jgi:hypothetical protein